MLSNECVKKAANSNPQLNENRVIFSNRQDYLLRYLVCDIAPIIGKVGHPTGTVFVLCFDIATEFLLTHELQAMGKYGPIRAESICFNYDADPHAARVQLHHLLKVCNILVGCWEHVLPILEAQEGPLLSFDMFDVLAIWDAQLVVGNDLYASFAKKYIREEADNLPKVLSFMTCYLDAAEIFATVELIKSRTLCKGNLAYLLESNEDASMRADHTVELTEEQKDLYDKIKEHMQQYESQLQDISTRAGLELFSPYAMGTQEYNEWLDAIHLLCYRQAKENPDHCHEVDMALALLRRLKQFNTSLKMVEETTCFHAIQLLTAAHQGGFSSKRQSQDQTTGPSDLANFSLFHLDSKPRSAEELYTQTQEDFEAFKSALPDAMKSPFEGLLDPEWVRDMVGEASSSLTPKASALLKRLQAVYKDGLQGKKVQALVICYCKSSMDYIMEKVKGLNIHCVQAYYLGDLSDVTIETDFSRTNRRTLRNQMEKTMKAKTHPIVLTTRFTTMAMPSMRDWEWTEVLHYDADIYSVVSNKLSEGWCPQIQHHYFMTENSEGAYQYNCQKNNLLRLEEHLPHVDKVGITWSVHDRYSSLMNGNGSDHTAGSTPATSPMVIKPCYSVPMLQPTLPGSSPGLTPMMQASASAPDLMLHMQSRSLTLSSLPDQHLARPLFDSMIRIDSTGELSRTESSSSKQMKSGLEEKPNSNLLNAARIGQLQTHIDQLKTQLSPSQIEVLHQIQFLVGISSPQQNPMLAPAATPIPEPIEQAPKAEAFPKPFEHAQFTYNQVTAVVQQVPKPPPIIPKAPQAPQAPQPPPLPPPPLPPTQSIPHQMPPAGSSVHQRPYQPPMLPMQYRGKYAAEDPHLMIMTNVPAYPGNAMGRGMGKQGFVPQQAGVGSGRGMRPMGANPRKHAKTFTQKVDRAQQQLLQAGEAEKLSNRGPPPPPWPLAMLAEPKSWNEEDAKQIWNHNHQKLFSKTPPTYYFGERHHDGNVLFTAETEVFCRLPHGPTDTEGEPVHLHGFGEAPTKKEAQKKAAIAVLKRLEAVGILHVPNHYAEGAMDADRRSEASSDHPSEIAKQLTVKRLLGEICQQVWNSKPTFTDGSRDRSRPPGQEFQCLLRVDGCPLQPSLTIGAGPSRRQAEIDAAEKFLNIIRVAMPEVVDKFIP